MRLIVIAALCAVAVDVAWFLVFAHYNRRKGILVLRWVEAACATGGRVLDTKWLSKSCLQAHVSFAAQWFENARVTVKLLPRPILIQWLVCLLRRQRETVTFEADLDDSPTFHLEISRHRWLTQKPKLDALQARPGSPDHAHRMDPRTYPGREHPHDLTGSQSADGTLPPRLAQSIGNYSSRCPLR